MHRLIEGKQIEKGGLLTVKYLERQSYSSKVD